MLRGHLRILTLKALEEKERSGYGLMKYVEQKIGSKPSTGSIYPILEHLKDEGVVKAKEEGRKKVYSLTKKGKEQAKCLEEKRKEILEKFGEGLKMLTAITGEDLCVFEEMFKHLKTGEHPLKHLNPEYDRFRHIAIKKFGTTDKEKQKRIRKILGEALKELRKI
jgi:formylmethanofuran dehydrogenase subunit E